MRKRAQHATRSLFALLPRRRGRSAAPATQVGLAQLVRYGGRSALSLAMGAVMVALIGLLLANFVGQVMQSARLETQRAELEAEVAQIRAANVEVEGAVAFTESDVYVERVAREQLGYAREGDVVLLPQLAPPTAAPAAPVDQAAPAVPAPPATPNWQRWLEAFFPVEQ